MLFRGVQYFLNYLRYNTISLGKLKLLKLLNSLLRFPGLDISNDFPSLISLLSSPAPDSRIATQISNNYDYSPCNVVGLKNATPICDFGYFPDPYNKMCYGLILISPDQNIMIGNASQYCNGDAKLLNLNSEEDINNLESLLTTGRIFFVNWC